MWMRALLALLVVGCSLTLRGDQGSASVFDGSAGHHGFVPDLIREAVAGLPAAERSNLVFINCGPGRMVRRCFDIQREFTSEDRIFGSRDL